MGNFASRIARAGRMTRAERTATIACALTFTCWNAAARGGLTLAAPVVFGLLCLACLLAGRAFCAGVLGRHAARDFPTVFLFGFFGLNSALYLLAWISPLSIVANALMLLAGVLAWLWIRPPAEPARDDDESASLPGLLTLALALIATTFWCPDSIVPEFVFREGVMIKPWNDSHFHACEIRMFRDARGYATLEDLRMSGRPVWLYHHASYLAPALISAVTGTSPFLAFGSFLVPAGLVLSGLAAHALVRSLWGGGAGLAAAGAVLLLPDASRHGLHNLWMSAEWLQRINPGGLYGVAVLGAAWLLMFAGCRSGRLVLIALGLVTASLSFHYKAHVFVASAPLILFYPGVFARGIPRAWKLAWLGLGAASLVTVAAIAERHALVPTLRLDGSSVKAYMNFIGLWSDWSSTRTYYATLFHPQSSWLHDVFWGSVLLFYGTVGLFGVANLALALLVLGWKVRGWPVRATLEHAGFPLLIIANYLVMALGLAYDAKSETHPEELRHRPLVWAYFVSAAWAGGLTYRLLLEQQARRRPLLRAALVAGLFALLIIPYRMGPFFQVGASWGWRYAWQSYPRGWFESARYIRETARPGEIAQDSRNDPMLVFSGECEHPAYAIAYFNGRSDPVLSGRLEELESFKKLTDAESIRRFAARRRIRWYVLHPETRVRWPSSFLAEPVFSWNGHRVFEFPPGRPGPPPASQLGQADEPRPSKLARQDPGSAPPADHP